MNYDLSEAVTDAIATAAETALMHFETGDMKNAVAVLNEWMTESKESLCTHHYTETIHTVCDEMFYLDISEEQPGLGIFTFNDATIS